MGSNLGNWDSLRPQINLAFSESLFTVFMTSLDTSFATGRINGTPFAKPESKTESQLLIFGNSLLSISTFLLLIISYTFPVLSILILVPGHPETPLASHPEEGPFQPPFSFLLSNCFCSKLYHS